MDRATKEVIAVNIIDKLSRYIMKIRDELAIPYGISPIQLRIIFDLNSNPNSKITDICQRLQKSTNSISPLIKRLESKGFIEKKRSIDDARITYVSLTKKSNDFIHDLELDIRDYTEPIFKNFTDLELDQILERFIKICEVIKE